MADWFAAKTAAALSPRWPDRLKFIQDLSERKTRIEWVRRLCVNWKRTRSLNSKSGAFLAPICNIYKFFALPCTIRHCHIHNSGLSVYYNNLIFIMDFCDDQNAFFSLANVFYVRRCRVLALPAKANTWPLPPAGSRLLAKTNFMWWKMTVVLWKPSQKI